MQRYVFFERKPSVFAINAKICRKKLPLSQLSASENHETPITRINDAFMENLLSDDASLLGKYMAVKNKHGRQSAANVLPILMEKGLVAGN